MYTLKTFDSIQIPIDALNLATKCYCNITNMVKWGYSDGRIIPSTKLTSLLYCGVNQVKTVSMKVSRVA